MDLTLPQWAHDPTRTPDNPTPDEIELASDGMTWDELHTISPRGRCMGCWCYACGGRTDQPRIVPPQDTRTPAELADLGPESPDHHRWCFE